MNKSKFIHHNILSKTNIALICVILMVSGFLFSRAILSLGMFLFGINALWNINPRRWFQNKYWLLGVVWVAAYAISWFWTDDKTNWSERFEVKLPILLLPLAFGFLPAFSRKQQHIFTITTFLVLLINVVYSLYFFFLTPAAYIYGYGVSHVLPTLSYGDHIRTSLFIALFIIWCLYSWKYIDTAPMKWFTGIMVGVLTLYLHILAARTGLLALYIFIALFAIYIGISRNRYLGIGMVIFLFLFGAFAYNYSPTLKNRIGYFKYTVIEYNRSGLQGHYSDMGRIISYDIGLRKIKQHALYGVGAGDILSEMNAGYDTWYPDVTADKRLVPHNQFMVVALGCGIPVLIIFVLWIIASLTRLKKNRSGFFFFAVWAVLLIPLLVEPMLEVQFGVFVYLFFLLWQKHAVLHEQDNE